MDSQKFNTPIENFLYPENSINKKSLTRLRLRKDLNAVKILNVI